MTLRSNSWSLDYNNETCNYSSSIYLVQPLTWYKPNLEFSNSPSEEKMFRKASVMRFVSHTLLTFFFFSCGSLEWKNQPCCLQQPNAPNLELYAPNPWFGYKVLGEDDWLSWVRICPTHSSAGDRAAHHVGYRDKKVQSQTLQYKLT